MLILSRKQNERIVIGEGKDAVVLMVVDLQHGKVRLGIEAPRETPIVREELIGRDGKRPAA
ncbi:MAG TPA: transcriptional regulator [Planctomycetaceae bacterium]|nr:transcriptional regulator [Planctomycetaceae bacterium]